VKHWDFHPTVRSNGDRSLGEQAADILRQGMGSWSFFLGFALAMVLWMVSGGFGFDPNPYFRLNLGLSLVAGMQGSVLLIAAKRQDRIDASVSRHHLEVSEASRKMLADLHHMMSELDRLIEPVVTTKD
jgi:uncharacterized membrane protein